MKQYEVAVKTSQGFPVNLVIGRERMKNPVTGQICLDGDKGLLYAYNGNEWLEMNAGTADPVKDIADEVNERFKSPPTMKQLKKYLRKNGVTHS